MTAVSAGYRSYRTRQIAYGRWQPWAENSERVREHVRQLRERGATYRAIADAAGVCVMTVHALMNQSGRVKAETAGALTGLTTEHLQPTRLPASGTRLRLRSLVAMGHSSARIATAMGVHPETIQRIVRAEAPTVSSQLHEQASRLYEAWWDKAPPEHSRAERIAAEASRQRARREGWCTGIGLDDERVDEPGYLPKAPWRRARSTGIAPENPLNRYQTEARAEASAHDAAETELEAGS